MSVIAKLAALLMASKKAKPTSFTFVDKSFSNTGTITIPSGVASGDILVMVSEAINSSPAAITAVTPSGFTLILNSASGGVHSRVVAAVKIADGTEGGTTVSVTSVADNGSTCLVFRPNIAGGIASITAAAASVQGFTPSTDNSEPMSGAGVPQVCIAAVLNAGTSPANTGTMTSATHLSNTANTKQDVYYKLVASSPADIDIAATNTNSQGILTVIIGLTF